jgi:hypothetical protein
MLLVVDDIWSRTQLEPFLSGAPNTVRLVTTRQHQVLPDTTLHIDVDAMAMTEARSVPTTTNGAVERLAWAVESGRVNASAGSRLKTCGQPPTSRWILPSDKSRAGGTRRWARPGS